MKKTTVFIGIPAHNEEKNIEALLVSIVRQKYTGFFLQKIVVACDGCTDGTYEIVKKFSKKNKIICLNDGRRIGQGGRLNQLFTLCKSDIFITLDADTKLASSNSLQNLVNKFEDPSVGLVGGNNLPTKPETLTEQALVVYESFWRQVTARLNRGENIHNCPGCIWAARKEFIKKIRIPKTITANDHFIYLSAIKSGYRFKFADKATLFFKLPNNVMDYLSQSHRFSSSRRQIETYFGPFCNKFYEIPISVKIPAYKKAFLHEPFLMSLAIILQIFVRIFEYLHKHEHHGPIWNPIYSSK